VVCDGRGELEGGDTAHDGKQDTCMRARGAARVVVWRKAARGAAVACRGVGGVGRGAVGGGQMVGKEGVFAGDGHGMYNDEWAE
jgi:Zn-dependent alcohol dehydrogenase